MTHKGAYLCGRIRHEYAGEIGEISMSHCADGRKTPARLAPYSPPFAALP